MLAEGGKGDVAQHDHLLVPLAKRRLKMLLRVFAQTGEELCVRLGDAMRGALQSLSIGVFADGDQDLAHRRLDARLVDVSPTGHEQLPSFVRERVMRTPAASSIDPFIGASGLRTVTMTRATGGNPARIAVAISSATASMS